MTITQRYHDNLREERYRLHMNGAVVGDVWLVKIKHDVLEATLREHFKAKGPEHI